MVRLEELEALDLLLWLQNSFTAAAVSGTNQSTICRRAQRVLHTFTGRLLRQKSGWRVESPLLPLLDLQRQIHQQVRLRQGQGLRLNVPHWSRQLVQRCTLPGWILNPEQGPLVCEQPLELLRSHVLDACLVTPTQLARRHAEDLVVFDLYASRIDLHLLGGGGDGGGAQQASPAAALDLLPQSRLELMPFLPSSCCESSRQRFEQLRRQFGPGSEDAAALEPSPLARVAFLTPVMALALQQRRPLSLQLDWPYRESLAVLRSQADQPAIQALLEQLRTGVPRALDALLSAA